MTDQAVPLLVLTDGVAQQWQGGAGILLASGNFGSAVVDFSFSDDGTNFAALGSQLAAAGHIIFAAPRNSWLKVVVTGSPVSLVTKVYRESGEHAWVGAESAGGGGGASGDVNLAQVGGSNVSLGQKTKTASIPVVLASDSDAATFSLADMLTLSGTISSAANLSNFPKTDCTGYRCVSVQWTTVTSGNTGVVEESNDGTTWTNITAIDGAASITATGLKLYNIAAKQVRLRCSVFASGSVAATAEFRAFPADSTDEIGAGAVGTRTARVTLASDDPLVATVGAKTDAKSSATDGTSISLMQVFKQISASVQAAATSLAGSLTVATHAVTQSGSWVLSAGAALIGKVGIDQTTPGTTDSVTVATGQGAGAAIGTTAGAKVITDANGTLQQYLRGLVSQWIAGTLVIGTGTNSIGNVGHGKTIKSVVINLTADTDIIAAVTSKRIKVIAYALFKTGTTASTILFKSNGTGGTEVARVLLQSQASAVFGANLSIAAPSFLFATAAGEKLTIDVGDSDTLTGFLTYFDDDAT